MAEDFANVYDDATRADAYATLEFPGTYYLAYRDIPAVIGRHVQGTRALDFGCGAGRSSRFVRELGFDVIGVDCAHHMLARARTADPHGDYRFVPDDGDLRALGQATFDLVLAMFTFDNIPVLAMKAALFAALRARLAPAGRIISLVSSPDIYLNEWASFTTRAFPENHHARSGDVVRIQMLDVADARPVEDIACSDADYREVFRRAGLRIVETHRPLGRPDEPFAWVSETRIAPWTIYVLAPEE